MELMSKFVCHSGGCPGSDMFWENESAKYGIPTIAYSFSNHVQESKNPKVLSLDELQEGWKHVEIAAETLKRPLYRIQYGYVRNLLSRNWYQVKNSEAVYAIGTFVNSKKKLVNGGTGWAVQMAIDNKKPAYLFDQDSNRWYVFEKESGQFEFINVPVLTFDFAGVGTRELNERGENAIKEILHLNMTPVEA